MKYRIKIILISIFTLGTLISKADIPNFDVVEFSNGDRSLYMMVWGEGVLKNHDLCYYTWEGDYIGEVQDVIAHFFKADSVEVYDELVQINLSKLGNTDNNGLNSTLIILKGEHKISTNRLKSNYSLIDAINGNTGGYIYSKELSNDDNIWINDYETEPLFKLSDYEICGMTFYSIKNNVSKERKINLKNELDSLLKIYDRDSFNMRLSELYKENIIMVGFCSC